MTAPLVTFGAATAIQAAPSTAHDRNSSLYSRDSFINSSINQNQHDQQQSSSIACYNGFLTFELTTGFIYTPSSAETLSMLPGTLQLTECLNYCLKNTSCQAVNFEMGLCVLLSSSAQQNPASLLSSQFPVFTIYAEKLCLLSGNYHFTINLHYYNHYT